MSRDWFFFLSSFFQKQQKKYHMKVVFVLIGVLFFFFFMNLVWALILQGFQNYVKGQGGHIFPTDCKLPKTNAKPFFLLLTFFGIFGKFKNCGRAVLKNYLYFFLSTLNFLGLVVQICPFPLAEIGLTYVYKKYYLSFSFNFLYFSFHLEHPFILLPVKKTYYCARYKDIQSMVELEEGVKGHCLIWASRMLPQKLMHI